MPTVLRLNGFAVKILLPPREHGPPHVHVFKGGTEVVIEIGERGELCRLREVHGMPNADVIRAFRLVEAHADALLEKWRGFHAK